MKRFTGIVLLLLFMATMMTAGCYGSGGNCPHGVCTEENSPQPPEK
jgi:hypothetical protein